MARERNLLNQRRYLAHSENAQGQPDPLCLHLTRVADRAAQFAAPFGAEDEARLAGLLHDIGKYGDLFQRRLQGRERGIDHWSAGAWEALVRCKQAGIAVALSTQGHHIGLQRASGDHLRQLDPHYIAGHTRERRLSGTQEQIVSRFQSDGLKLKNLDGLHPRSPD